MKQILFNNLKNLYGWKTKRKIIVFSVDDYGNVRLESKAARKNLDNASLKVLNRFDAYDTLETREDLEALYEVLDSVKDKHGTPAIFTPFALPCNINFDAMALDGNERYIYELLPETYSKLSALDSQSYEGAWELWKEGIMKGFMRPQFHGREHFNLKVFEEKLKNKDKEVLTNLRNRSYTSISSSGYSSISYTAAFEFWKFKENKAFESIVKDGLTKFKEVYGYSATQFNPPGGREHSTIHKYLKQMGIEYLDTPFLKKEHQGMGKFKTIFNWTGKMNQEHQIYQVRNVVLEPTQSSINHAEKAFQQIQVAFKWGKPAIISSHRVNFCGHIDQKNRKIGLSALQSLLKKIIKTWPEVEFMAANELGDLITRDKQK